MPWLTVITMSLVIHCPAAGLDDESESDALVNEWTLTWDDRVDGELDRFDKSCHIRFRKVEDKLTGEFSENVFGVERDATFSAQLIPGSPSILLFSQLEPDYTCVYQIHWTEDDVRNQVGTWRDTQGNSGDFRLNRRDKPLEFELKLHGDHRIEKIDTSKDIVDTPVGKLIRLSKLEHVPMPQHPVLLELQTQLEKNGERIDDYFFAFTEADAKWIVTLYHGDTLHLADALVRRVQTGPGGEYTFDSETGELQSIHLFKNNLRLIPETH